MSVSSLTSLATWAVVIAGFAGLAVRLLWLTAPAAGVAGLLGLLAVSAFGGSGLATLLAPFLVATLLGKLPKGIHDEGPRKLVQVAANGAPALLGCVLAWAGRSHEGSVAFAGALAALGADTVATEVGTRYGGDPRHALSMRRVVRGESGGVTALGLLASVAGAVLAPAAAAATRGLPWKSVPLVLAAGVLAGYADSVLGAVVQYRGRCGTCSRVTEARICCGVATSAPHRLRPGNDAVNFLNGVLGAVVAWALVRVAEGG